ncbi:hypothetical protein LCGC14_0595200 [marine sediment metagenome]|uniref:Uncharacterized protein n=1 Tax=marine sediment metagenome TaxID=412755 RepID=A0A0F9TYF7_9ZZZZ
MSVPKHSHATESQGGTLKAQNVLSDIGDLSGFGDGSDGDVTIAAPTTLTRTMFYDTLTIAAGGSIDVAGFEIYARVLVDIEATGIIHSDGDDAVLGTGGVTVANGEVDGRQAGGDSGDNAVGSVGVVGAQGGAGGAGGAATAAGGVGGAAGDDSTSQVRFRAPGNAVIETGAGGGGGGGDATPGEGGGGGASGGEVSIHAPEIRVAATGRISANGGAGAVGVTANGGGGGGGGGGKVRLNYRELTNNGTIEAAAGALALGVGTGLTGVIGDAGIVEQVVA